MSSPLPRLRVPAPSKVAATNPGNPYNHGHAVDWTYTLVRLVEAQKARGHEK